MMEAGINGERLQLSQSYQEDRLDSTPDVQSASTFRPNPSRESEQGTFSSVNLNAAISNGYVAGTRDDPLDESNPDEFYRDYRAFQIGSSNNDQDLAMTNGIISPSSTRQYPSSLRSNSNGTIPKYPSIATTRNASKPSYRVSTTPNNAKLTLSAAKSSPSLNGSGRSQSPSVKDLLKRFDENHQDTTTTRLLNRQNVKDYRGAGANQISARTGVDNGRVMGISKKGLTSQDREFGSHNMSVASRNLQRSQFNAENALPYGIVPTTSNTTRTRNQISSSNQASQSMISLSIPQSIEATGSTLRKPLFGEVTSEGFGTLNLGYGIEDGRRRRTSESHPRRPVISHRRTRSDLDISPVSPTAWYRGMNAFPDQSGQEKSPDASQYEHREHNNPDETKSNPSRKYAALEHGLPKPRIVDPSKGSLQTRLPVSSKRLHDHSSNSMSASRNTVSPTTLGSASVVTSRKQAQRRWSPPGRTVTPLTRSPGPRVGSPGITNNGGSTLRAYISTPPPKTSPTLRSSRPRQPVSTAATVNVSTTRDDTAQRYAVQSKHDIKTRVSEADDGKKRSRSGIVPPVDYAARRERIQRAFSKTIQETEKREHSLAKEQRNAASQPNEVLSAEVKLSDVEIHTQEFPPTPEVVEKVVSLAPKTNTMSPHQPRFRSEDADVMQHAHTDSMTLDIPGELPGENMPLSAESDVFGLKPLGRDPMFNIPTPSIESDSYVMASTNSTDTSTEHSVQLEILSHTIDDNKSTEIGFDATSVDDISNTVTRIDLGQSSDTSFEVSAQEEQNQPRADGLHHSNFAQSHHGTGDRWDTNRTHPPKVLTDTTSLPPLGCSADGAVLSNISVSPVTDMDYGNSEDAIENEETISGEAEVDNVPKKEDFQRFSNQSTWTDYSVGTNDESSWRDIPDSLLGLPTFSFEDRPPLPPPKERTASPRPEVPSTAPSHSPQSHQSTWDIQPPSTLNHITYLEQLSTSKSLRVDVQGTPQDSQILSSPSIPPIPSLQPAVPSQVLVTAQGLRHSPPPVSLYNRHASFDTHRSHRDSGSIRGSMDDVLFSRLSLSSPKSVSQASIDGDTLGRQSSVDEPVRSDYQKDDGDEKSFAKEKSRLRHRQLTIKELIDTEASYLKDMNVVEEIYKGTAEACPRLDRGEIKAIFRNTDEIVAFSTRFLDDLKAACASIYTHRSQRSRQSRVTEPSISSGYDGRASSAIEESDWSRDQKTIIGATFGRHIPEMQAIYSEYLKNSEHATSRLMALQSDATVKVWLEECNSVAKDLTSAWDLDALMVKPVQRVTRYQLLLATIRDDTPVDHPDYEALCKSCMDIISLLTSIDNLKKRIDTVSKIVGRKRKDSDGRTNLTKYSLAKAFARRDKFQSSNSRPTEDEMYRKLHDKFGDDYLRLQVVLRDVEFYTRQVATYVNEFLRYLSAMELIMRVSPSSYPELESKWARFNMSMRDMGTVVLEDHISAVRKHVIEPFEHVIKAYGPPNLAMKKRTKRRADYEKFLHLKSQNKKIDDKLSELADQFEALNETLKLELPKLTAFTEKIANLCLVKLISLQTQWYGIWQEKVKVVLEESQLPGGMQDILESFYRDFKYQQARASDLGIMNGTFLAEASKDRHSQTVMRDDDSSLKTRSRPSTLDNRSRALSSHSDHSPSLPTPDFVRQDSGQFTFSPVLTFGTELTETTTSSVSGTSRSHVQRPSSGRSSTSGARIHESIGSSGFENGASRATSLSHHQFMNEGLSPSESFSDIFHSAMPAPENVEDDRRPSRASSHISEPANGFNVLYLAASLFEFNIHGVKTEAGYPYLTYQAGEIFDVIGEKGEIWLAKNQDDPTNRLGWIWSKHFARLAAD